MSNTPSLSTRITIKSRLLLGVLFFLLLTGAAAAVSAVHDTNTTASDLVVNKSVDTGDPLPDQVVTFSVKIFNSGVISATNGTLTDDLDNNLTFVGPVTIEGGGDTAVPGVPPTIASGLTISPSMGVTVTFPVRINSGLAAGTEIKNTAVAESSEMGPANSNEVELTVAAATKIIWKQRSAGIDGGRVNVLALDPQNTDILYAGTPVGVFKSGDGGSSWKGANNGLDNVNIQSLALDPLYHDLLYAGTQEGVFKSSDGGSSWSAANNGLAGSSISSLAVDPGQPATLYAGTEAGIFKSTDRGNSWSEASAGLTDPQISALAIDPQHSNTLYAGTLGSGVFKSSDGGSSWAPANNGLTNLNVYVLQPDPLNHEVLYVGTGSGLFKSENAGSNWSTAGADLTTFTILSLAVDPVNNGTLYAGSENGIAKSTDGGSNWSPISESAAVALAIDPFSPTTLYAGTTENGVFKSINGGGSWNWSSHSLSGGKISAIAIDLVDSNLIFTGTPGKGVFKSSNGGGSWTSANNGLANLDVYTLAIPSGSNTLVYAGTGGGIFKSSDDGDSWAAANTGLTNTAVRALIIHPNNIQYLYAGTDGGGIFRSNNGGFSWTAANNGLTDTNITALAIDPNDPQILFAGTKAGGVFKSSNNGSSWIAINSGLTTSHVQTLVIDPAYSQLVFAGGPGGVFKSSDGGGSWEESSSGLEDVAVSTLAFDPDNSGILYAATAADGIFRSTGSGFNWTAVNKGLTVQHIRALALASSNTLYAGSNGGGVFASGPHLAMTKLADNPDPNSGDALTYTIFITNTGTLSITNGTVSDNLNGSLKFTGPVSITGNDAAGTAGSPPMIVQNLAMKPGGTAKITLPVQVKTGLPHRTIIPNTVSADAPQLHAPASAQITSIVYSPNKLITSQTVDEPNPQPGQTVTFTINVENIGAQGVGGIDVMNLLDSNLTFLGPVEISGSSGSTGSPPLIASGMGLDAGRNLSVRFTARINGHVLPGTVIDNSTSVTSLPWPVPISSQSSLVVEGPEARHIFVNEQAAAGANDGTSWENAYTSLLDALLNAGSGSEIWVAAGVYYPDVGSGVVDDDPAATFQLRSGVSIYGGFAGTESSLDERDLEANPTVLSGDIDGNDMNGCATMSGAEHIKGNNSRHVVNGSGATSSALLDGFIITAGHAQGPAPDHHGGGMFNREGSPTLANIIFCGNKANGSGGGIFNDAASPILRSVQFANNMADLANGRGGGMANVNGSQPTLENVDFNNNQAYYGGGIFNNSSKASILKAILDGNQAAWGGGIFNSTDSDGMFGDVSLTSNKASGGGGMTNDSSSPTLTNITWAGNQASQWGGGLSSSGGDPQLANPVFSGNLAEAQANGQQSWGGGLYVSGGEPTIANATVTGNWAAAAGTRPGDEGLGGGLFVAAGEVTILNSIFWKNEGDRTPDLIISDGGTARISSSRLDGCPQNSVCDNLISADPNFALPIDPTSAPTVDGNFSLQPSSPLVDAGNNSFIPAGVTTDRSGEARIHNGVVDLGAFEQPLTCPETGAVRLYVNGSNEGGDNNGLDWENALHELSHALTLAQGCQESRIIEIWVAAGKYVPLIDGLSAAEVQDASFNLSDGLAVYGGFAGTELVLKERDWLQNWTILSGDIEGNDPVAANGLLTDTMKIEGKNSYHVITSVDNDATAVLDGFIINGGQANGWAATGDDSGGGIYNEDSNPTLSHLTILANEADDGGGIANISDSKPTLTNVHIEGNNAIYFGGGVFNENSNSKLTNLAIVDNDATRGGGIFNAISSPRLVNVTVAGNKAAPPAQTDLLLAAGYKLQDLRGTARATSSSGGGMFNLNNSRPIITNSIFWQNWDETSPGSASATISNDASSIPLIGYSLIQASGGSGAEWNGSMGFDHGHNIDEDPLFFTAEDRRLKPGSPAIDVGDNTANGSEHDLDVKPRITDGTNDGEAVIDLGAYETTLMAIKVTSTADTTAAKVGDTVTFTYVVINEGEVSLQEIKAVDDKLGEITLDATSLDSGEWTSGTLSYMLQESDIGTMVTTVTVSGKSASGAEVSAEDTIGIEVRPGVYRSFIPILIKS